LQNFKLSKEKAIVFKSCQNSVSKIIYHV